MGFPRQSANAKKMIGSPEPPVLLHGLPRIRGLRRPSALERSFENRLKKRCLRLGDDQSFFVGLERFLSGAEGFLVFFCWILVGFSGL